LKKCSIVTIYYLLFSLNLFVGSSGFLSYFSTFSILSIDYLTLLYFLLLGFNILSNSMALW